MARNRQNRRGVGPRRGRGRGRGRGGGEPQFVTKPLTRRGLRQETRASTNLKFGPLERAIDADVRASDRRVGEVGGWWDNYNAIVNQGRSETQAAYQQAGAEGTAQIDAASAADATRSDALQAEAAKSAELRGAPVSTDLAGREAAAQAQRNYLAAAQGGATAQMGANQYAYLTRQRDIGVGQSIASRKEEQRRGRTFRKDRRDVRKERGEYATAKRGELRGEERDYLIQRSAFGLDKKKAAAAEREGAANRAQDERASRRTAQSNARSNAQDERASKRGAKGEGGRSPSERNDAREGRRNAAATAQSLFESKEWPSWSALERAVRKESEVSPAEARRAVAKLRERVERAASKKKKPSIVGTVIPGEQITE